jgi:hypothetical protein
MALTPRFEDALVCVGRNKLTTADIVVEQPGRFNISRGSARWIMTLTSMSDSWPVKALEHGANEDEAIAALLHDTVAQAKTGSWTWSGHRCSRRRYREYRGAEAPADLRPDGLGVFFRVLACFNDARVEVAAR